jgi:hypothetical protein
MNHFPDVMRVRCLILAEGLGLGASRFGSAMIFDRTIGVSSHQPSRSTRKGSRDRRTGRGMIFAMAGPWRADWQRVCATRRGIADFCAGFAQTRFAVPSSGGGRSGGTRRDSTPEFATP